MKKKEKKHLFSQLIEEHKSYLYFAIFLSIFVAYLPVAPIAYMRTVFGPVVNSDSLQYLYWLTLLLISALLLNAVLEWVRDRIMAAGTISFCAKLENHIYAQSFEKGEEAWTDGTRAMSSLRVIRNFMVSPIFGAILDAPFSILLLFVIFLIHPIMGYFSLIGATLAFLIGILIEKKVAPHMDQAADMQSQSRSCLSHCFKNIVTSASRGNIDRMFHKWRDLQKQYLVHQGRASGFQAFGSSCSQVVMMFQGSMLLGVGMALSLLDIIDIRMAGNLIIAKFIGALAIRPAMMVVMGWTQVMSFRESVADIKEFLGNYREELGTKTTLPQPEGVLKVIKVSFSEERTQRTILSGVNFLINPGNIMVIMGPSGSGKTTLLKLLGGIYTPAQGSVRLDGVSLSKWNREEISPHLGYLPQETELFGGLASENIARFQRIDNKKLESAYEEAGIIDLYNNYLEGKDIQLDSDINLISGGLKQRIGLARAFYGSPKLLLLDEPTANLDSGSRLKLIDTIKKYRERNSLVIVATHDRDLLLLADYILIVKSGVQISFDSREDLMKRLSKK